MAQQSVTIWSLEMNTPDQLNFKPAPENLDFVVQESRIKNYPLNRFLYSWVGAPYQWTDKLSWSDAQWQAYAENDDCRLWVGYLEGTPAGYFELRKKGSDVEIAYFGLAEPFIEQGLGGHLLSQAIREAWQWDAQRVWVHTCTKDHPYALKNYIARGMTVYKEEQHS